MPEWGMCDKSPAEIEEEIFFNSMAKAFRDAEAAAADAQVRQETAQAAALDMAASLRRLQQQLDDYHAKYEALKKGDAAQRAKDAKQAFFQSIISGIIGSVIGGVVGGLLVYYWPVIERSFFGAL